MIRTDAKSCPICEQGAVPGNHRCQDYYDLAKPIFTVTDLKDPIVPRYQENRISIPLDLLLDIFGELHAFSDRTDILDRIKAEMEVL